jgi:thiamine biosynthesis lipoprotein
MSPITNPASVRPRRAWVEHIMGLPISLHVRGAGVASADVGRRVEAVFGELRAMDAIFSTYRRESQISRLNRREIAPAACAPVVRDVIDLCGQARAATDGAFDAHHLPLPDGGSGFDPSGLVKGWAVERAARHLSDLEDHDYLLNAGGDVVASTAPLAAPWRIGVEDPAGNGQLLAVVELSAGAVATSGTAHRGAHIVDPRTGKPMTALRSATVTGPQLLWADVYATAAIARGPAALAWLDTLQEYEALLVDAAGRTHATAGWPR